MCRLPFEFMRRLPLLLLTRSNHFQMLKMNPVRHSSVGIIIIGDEILKGEVKDTNSGFLCRELYALGVSVRQIAVVRDELEMLAEVVQDFSQKYSYVITSGGIGPTHDDITYEGIALAFGETLTKHPQVSQEIGHWCKLFGFDEKAAMRMEMVPKSCQVHMISIGLDGLKKFPLISVKNVYAYPGIPHYLEKLFQKTKNYFSSPSSLTFKCSTLYTSAGEFTITGALNKAVQMFEKKVRFGSYPATKNEPYQVRITLEADEGSDLEEAEAYLRSLMPRNSLVGPNQLGSKECIRDLYETNDQELKDLVHSSMKIIEECFSKFGPKGVCLSFNGGKDCTVLLHLSVCVMNKMYSSRESLQTFYVQQKDSFSDLDDFVNLSVTRYQLTMYVLSGQLKPALFELTSQHPELRAVLIGTRRTDPRSISLDSFQPTDADWPPLMRVNPLLDWSYHNIWHFLRHFHVPYCSLYDQGYTSLGSPSDTDRNPRLRTEHGGHQYFRPAYLLKDPSEEREGRC